MSHGLSINIYIQKDNSDQQPTWVFTCFPIVRDEKLNFQVKRGKTPRVTKLGYQARSGYSPSPEPLNMDRRTPRSFYVRPYN
jgi:hypothetical protein